jgi:predicted DsbA family dithiol-disulfide isomerase
MQDFAYADRVEIQWRSFQLNPNAPRDSNEGIMEHLAKKFGTSRKKVEEMTESMAQRAALVGLTFNHKDAIVTNTYDVHRLIHLAGKHGIQNEAKERFLRAYFTEGKHIGNAGELKALSIEIGLPESEVDGILYGDEFKDAVNQDIEEAKRIGINGVPFFLIDRKYTISGAQPVSVFSQILSKVGNSID